MIVLGIETSCDETSVAVVKDGRKILSNAVSSSLRFHKKYGGVVPEIASRMQLETITQVAQQAIKESRAKLKQIGFIAVTNRPGLLGSLLTGISFAKAVSLALGVPILGVDHVYSHIYANFFNRETPRLPFVALVVSGGHTSLFFVKDFDRIEVLGQTQDDACGEAFDKVAKILGLGYPGGPIIEKIAQKAGSKRIMFRCSGTDRELDFSFSGIKTAVLYAAKGKLLTTAEKKDIAASFQECVLDALVTKSLAACKLKKANQLVIGGGVAVNFRLREKILIAAKDNRIKCFFPPQNLCADNAAMIAGLGYQLFKKGKFSGLDLSADLN